MEVALILKYRYTWSDHQKKTTMKNLEKKNKDHLGAGGVIIRSRVCVAGRS